MFQNLNLIQNLFINTSYENVEISQLANSTCYMSAIISVSSLFHAFLIPPVSNYNLAIL